jgi:tetraacyldisaccharide 4'-kinase
LLDFIYSQIARARRRYYQRRPHVRRRLDAPVISIGNLTVGGSGKTPLAAEIARMLVQSGERPSILSRGYARQHASEGVVVVSDGSSILAEVEESGDEPLMLARMVPGAAVLVSSSRFAAGRLAETRLGRTVHILDDGFQHFDLMRDVDLLVAPDTLEDVRTLPFGRFREPIDAAVAADALLVEVGEDSRSADLQVSALAAQLKVSTAFEFTRRLAGPQPDRPAFAFAGIARPERFFADLERGGWKLTGRRSFADHRHYSEQDVARIERDARGSGAQVILTTEKDLVRMRIRPELPIVSVPLEINIRPPFQGWLGDRLKTTWDETSARVPHR